MGANSHSNSIPPEISCSPNLLGLATTISAPFSARMMLSMASRSGVPGATSVTAFDRSTGDSFLPKLTGAPPPQPLWPSSLAHFNLASSLPIIYHSGTITLRSSRGRPSTYLRERILKFRFERYRSLLWGDRFDGTPSFDHYRGRRGPYGFCCSHVSSEYFVGLLT